MPPIVPLTPGEKSALQAAIAELTEDNSALQEALDQLQSAESGLQTEDNVLRKIHEGIGTGNFGTGSGLIPAWEYERKHQTGKFVSNPVHEGTPTTSGTLQFSAVHYSTPLFPTPVPPANASTPWKVAPSSHSAVIGLFGGNNTFADNERDALDDEEAAIDGLLAIPPASRNMSNPTVAQLVDDINEAVAKELLALDEQLSGLSHIIATGEITDSDPVSNQQLITAQDVADAETAQSEAETFKAQTQAWQVNTTSPAPDLSDLALNNRKSQIDARESFIDNTRAPQILAVLGRLWNARYYWIGLRFNQRSGTFLNLNGNQGAQAGVQSQIEENTAAIAAIQNILANQ